MTAHVSDGDVAKALVRVEERRRTEEMPAKKKAAKKDEVKEEDDEDKDLEEDSNSPALLIYPRPGNAPSLHFVECKSDLLISLSVLSSIQCQSGADWKDETSGRSSTASTPR